MSFYIAGPMRGLPKFNFPAFDECAEYLRAQRWEEVVSPAEHDREMGFDETAESLEGFDIAAAILWDLDQVARVDAIVLLPGWEKSSGVAAELALARFLGKEILTFDPLAPHGLRIGNLADEPCSAKAPVPASAEQGEIRVVNESTGGAKGQKLARYDLLPAGPLQAVAEHYGRGARKYEDRNWERGYDWSLSFGAMQRHAWQFWGGEDRDEETGSHHMAAVCFHALALIEFATTHPELDDRATAAREAVSA